MLFVLWLLMSGLFKPLLIGFGIFSSILCAWIIGKLGLYEEGARKLKSLRGIQYLFWLIVEIGKADWAVAKAILGSKEQLRQQLIIIPARQHSDMARTLFANSITITPGTVCVDTGDDHFVIHALGDSAADKKALARMHDRVCALEKDG